MRHLFALLVVALSPALAEAQTDRATLNAAFTGLARLSFSANSITFVDADPDFVPQVSSSPATITISTKARASSGGTVTLSVQASDDLLRESWPRHLDGQRRRFPRRDAERNGRADRRDVDRFRRA